MLLYHLGEYQAATISSLKAVTTTIKALDFPLHRRNRKWWTAMGNLQKFKIIKKCLVQSAAVKVMLGLVIADIDYTNVLYLGPLKAIHRLAVLPL